MGFSFSLSLAAIFFLLSWALLPLSIVSHPVSTYSIHANFTATNFQFIDTYGTFLSSQNGTFKASISNLDQQPSHYYFSVSHADSNSVIWSANRNAPMSSSDEVSLTTNGLTVVGEAGNVLWSTPPLNSAVDSMQLLETGNLVLVDARNNTLWESFQHPTDTIVVGQRIRIGTSLQSAVSDVDMSPGDYRLEVTDGDAVLQWNTMTYWELSMDAKASKNSIVNVSFLEMNESGLYLLGSDGSTIVTQVALTYASDFRIGKLGSEGRFSISRFVSDNWLLEFAAPAENCRIPLFCRKIGLCTSKPLSASCSCPLQFRTQIDGECVPMDSSLSLPSACNDTRNTSQVNINSVTYIGLGSGMDYFAIDFMNPVRNGISLSLCQDLCSANCSCLGIFHGSSSLSCYLLENYLGSIILSSKPTNDYWGYIKVLASSSSPPKHKFPIAALVLLPSSGFLILTTFVILGIVCLRKNTLSKTGTAKWSRCDSSSSADLEIISIPGLPRRFDYEELVAATENFKTQIGKGGFGTVYKGTLSDKSVVAVKKMTSLGVEGKKEFCTEIAVIGNIHHVNLVRLKGFCVRARQRFLVLEYMSKGSLDRTLFGNGPVLEWGERVEIALGTARGLAYLHSGCEHKIIHCDVKPQNILLHDNLQVKISDFGLSKLLSPEQSGLYTTMRGTRGYLAPEWLTSSAISDKSDVYGYGMVLLEIVRGRKNSTLQTWSDGISGGDGLSTSSYGSETRSIYFPLCALEMHEQNRYLELADRRLEGRVTSEEVEKLVRIALCCVHEDPALRPTMANVVSMLEGGLPVGEPRVDSLNFLRYYGRRFTEVSRKEGSSEQDEFGLYDPSTNPTSETATNGSYNSMSYLSSQQVSGPR